MRAAPLNTQLTAANQEWALDFITEALASGRGLRILTVVDSFTRECPAIEVNTSLSGRHVTRVLDRVIEQRGKPQTVKCDNALNARPFFVPVAHGSSSLRDGSVFSISALERH